jgi:cytochrome P450
VWLVTGYQEVRAGLADPRLSKDMRAAGHVLADDAEGQALRSLPMPVAESLIYNENPTRLRRLAAEVFTVRRVESLRPRIAELTAALIAPLHNRSSVDLVTEVAKPLPMLLMCGLLGLSTADADKLRTWTETLLLLSARADGSLRDHLAAVADNDLVDALTTVDATDEELLALVAVLIIGGYEIGSMFVGNAVVALLANPQRMALARHEPALLPDLLDDLIRDSDPLHMGAFRYAKAPIALGGTRIPAGEVVMLSAPPSRLEPQPASFGHGIQYLIGAALGRALGETVLEMLIVEFPDMHLTVPAEQIPRHFTLLTHSVETLPVHLH